MEERVPTTAYLWVSRLAGLVGIVCILLAAITGLTGITIVIAKASTLILAAIASFLIAIWAVLYEIRDYGLKTK